MRPDKYGRIYQRMTTGLQIARNNKEMMRFMTLTTAKNSYRTLKKSFDVLRKHVERAKQEKDGFKGFKLNRYFCLRTSEGNGVLHIIFWGGHFIPQSWLSRQWEKIHGASIVDIRKIYTERRKVNGLVNYLLTNYLQRQPIERMSYGWLWAWLGFCKSWQKVKEIYGSLRATGTPLPDKRPYFYYNLHNKAVSCWQSVLHGHPHTSRQIKLNKFCAYDTI